MRVAICGASGTGKTTLAKAIAEEFGLPINPVGSRSVAKKMGFANPYDVDMASEEAYENWLRQDGHSRDWDGAAQFAIERFCDYPEVARHEATCREIFQRRLQKEKIAWEKKHEDFVTDRTTLDDMCYFMLHAPECVDKAFIARAVKHCEIYTTVIWLPVTGPGGFVKGLSDPARKGDVNYQRAYEMLLLGALTFAQYEAAIELFTVKSKRLQQRRAFAFRILHGFDMVHCRFCGVIHLRRDDEIHIAGECTRPASQGGLGEG